ncbi:hypothetical protein DICSQDRAFT_178617 [Dichomitus squalens LYAD-421 SS1]|uniref:F-box only protein 9 n=1 Tax=Dichomitus squalens TaxID=114155 RepID=A0A4Q9MIG0_9APHY|nr:uncharacterized protein DICSQDRAFT_178617 [Dichomitus squalens LYAD-421 SS1]EJF64105.1 hypothetical protein DICSQDRAFT_178617 [Dichomitus squalens LYAD-421 SS1]TBU27294.1 hypothetical protein BD311DRAFT_866231 [Dichomitus squalens]
MQGSVSAVAAEDNEELARFRRQWLEEVWSKKKPQGSQDGAAAFTPTSTSAEPATQSPPQSPPAHRTTHRRASHHNEATSPVLGARKVGPASATAQFGPSLQRAVEVYRKAVQHEQKSELDDALRLYRSAFRMDSNVDRAYQLFEEELHRKAAAASPTQKAQQHKKTPSGTAVVEGLLSDMQALDLGPSRIPVAHAYGEGFVTGTLANLISSWPPELTFERDPESEEEGVPIRMLPDEILIIILRRLDHSALERFARVNRKARVITLDASIWRPRVQTIYRPPQIPDEEELEALVVKYMTDYRRIYIEHPRVRYDGVYIAVCHYIRNGVGENVWVNYSHLITYYRYLRFYPDGQVLSLLANEEHSPSQVIPILKPTLRKKGFFIGTWYLDGTELHIDDLLPKEPTAAETRYSFQMVLDLRSRPVGRWNRLDFRSYDSVHIASGEATPLALKNERSFWFSKVRSYV